MLIFMMLFVVGIILTLVGVFGIAKGVFGRKRKFLVLGVVLPILYWAGFWALWSADQRFIQEEMRKNGGELPDWVW